MELATYSSALRAALCPERREQLRQDDVGDAPTSRPVQTNAGRLIDMPVDVAAPTAPPPMRHDASRASCGRPEAYGNEQSVELERLNFAVVCFLYATTRKRSMKVTTMLATALAVSSTLAFAAGGGGGGAGGAGGAGADGTGAGAGAGTGAGGAGNGSTNPMSSSTTGSAAGVNSNMTPPGYNNLNGSTATPSSPATPNTVGR